jgi:hypothetical protein
MKKPTTTERKKRGGCSCASPGSAEYHHCGGCGRRLKIHRQEEVSGVALYVNGHKSCIGSSARVIEWLSQNGKAHRQTPGTAGERKGNQ